MFSLMFTAAAAATTGSGFMLATTLLGLELELVEHWKADGPQCDAMQCSGTRSNSSSNQDQVIVRSCPLRDSEASVAAVVGIRGDIPVHRDQGLG